MATENTGSFEKIYNTHQMFFQGYANISKEIFLAQKVSCRIKQMMDSYVCEIDKVIDLINQNRNSYALSKQMSVLKHISKSQSVAIKKLLDYVGKMI